MRVIAGRYRGARLRAPRGEATRPTSDRVREALFSILASVDGARVLDLFAGSGALGIEALSAGRRRGSVRRLGAAAVAAIRHNLRGARTAGRSGRSALRSRSSRRQRIAAPNTIWSSWTPHTGWRASLARSSRSRLPPVLARRREGGGGERPPRAAGTRPAARRRAALRRHPDQNPCRPITASHSVPGHMTRSPMATWTSSAGRRRCSTRSSSRSSTSRCARARPCSRPRSGSRSSSARPPRCGTSRSSRSAC